MASEVKYKKGGGNSSAVNGSSILAHMIDNNNTLTHICLLPFSKWRPITSHKVGQRSIKHMILS
jgi:hypothetical protein